LEEVPEFMRSLQVPQPSGKPDSVCFCPLNATVSVPTETEFTTAYAAAVDERIEEGDVQFVNRIQNSTEVVSVNCAVDVNQFSTMITMDILVDGSTVPPDELAHFATSFVDTYNLVAEEFCDDLFRRITPAEVIGAEEISVVEGNITLQRATLRILACCRGCDCQHQNARTKLDRRLSERSNET
jgi:hypothetical protein